MRSLSRLVFVSFTFAVLALTANHAIRAQEASKVKIGDKAPTFESVDEAGKTWKSADHVGKKVVVLYFYPADFTGGCTAQACSFRDEMPTLQADGVEIVGVSGDTAKTHELFKNHHKLNFSLLADEKGDLAKAFGVPVNVKPGKATGIDSAGNKIEVTRGATISRYTVVINKAGNIAAIDQVSKAGEDAKRIEKLVKDLK